MVRPGWHVFNWAKRTDVRKNSPRLLPIRHEAELAIGVAEAPDEMRSFKIRLHIKPVLGVKRIKTGPFGRFQCLVDDLARSHVKAPVLCLKSRCKIANHIMVGPTLTRCLHQFTPEHDVLVPAALVDVVVFQKHGGGQNIIRHCRSLGHELLMHHGK